MNNYKNTIHYILNVTAFVLMILSVLNCLIYSLILLIFEFGDNGLGMIYVIEQYPIWKDITITSIVYLLIFQIFY